MVKSTPTDFAMAIMCKTAFVEPPKTIIIIMALWKALAVIMSLGLMSFSNRILIN